MRALVFVIGIILSVFGAVAAGSYAGTLYSNGQVTRNIMEPGAVERAIHISYKDGGFAIGPESQLYDDPEVKFDDWWGPDNSEPSHRCWGDNHFYVEHLNRPLQRFSYHWHIEKRRVDRDD